MSILSFFRGLFAKKHKRIGLALGSGGAKGFAEIGALKAFDEEGIKFDIVAGSSIGSIVGAMYACGHSYREMLGIFREYNFLDPKKLAAFALRRKTLTDVFNEILGGKHFEDTELPFAAVAANINTGETVVMRHGEIASALAASSAIPPIFKPVERLGVKLVDGACVNAVPADVVKDVGADFVISVSLSSEPSNEGIKRSLDSMYKGHKIELQDRLRQCRECSDVIITPDLSAFKSIDFLKGNAMFDVGYEAAKRAMPEIKAKLKTLR